LALRRAGHTVVGYSRRAVTRQRALEIGAIDEAVDFLTGAADADVVLLAPPVIAIRALLAELAPDLRSGTVVTDAASTKADVERWARASLPQGVHWVGSHPMAGKETAGIEHADGSLFDGRTWCVVPPPGAEPWAVERVAQLARATGARTIELDAQAHDRAVAAVSHLPFTVGAVIAHAVIDRESFPAIAPIAGTGLRDMTRLASGDAIMHRDICLTNRDNIVRELEHFSERLGDMIALLRQLPAADGVDTVDGSSSATELGDLFEHLKRSRDEWLRS
jgi:prephenate dehydrogenase